VAACARPRNEALDVGGGRRRRLPAGVVDQARVMIYVLDSILVEAQVGFTRREEVFERRHVGLADRGVERRRTCC